ncbi:MAG TPA: GntR family transcriptional regulator [Amaricoccus sp.]|uniref:GntR family transcriptional regulator n=1 Tax=Amaricoccus sp. TaxID=1872485 RepID=UPI002C7382BA|nr:GntR family transcriptional regulator [Amaricoccus sp.]HMQ93812.1 GntR family transcriptional regulator [Amaricoccus sp.]HMR53801.1 GntR family transcriptional regulator [Amaricoccus sp.]HMU01357.1 GntR family transcriptional regulator [Amaricoccus sp.]
METVRPTLPIKRPLRRRSLHAEAVETLREMIIAGELAPGVRLIEAELCELFSISRTPLREALRVLEVEGLVDFYPNRGAVVSTISAEEVVQQFEVLANLERVALELAMARMSPADLARINRMHDRMIALYEAKQRRECFQKDFDIHNRIVALCGNPVLRDMHAGLMTRSRRVRYFALHSKSRWSEAMSEHQAFMQAINDKDIQRASLLMRDHVLRTGFLVGEFVSGRIDASPEMLSHLDRESD